MTETTNPESIVAAAQTGEDRSPAAAGQRFDRPIVLKYKRGKNKKKGNSKAFRDAQKTESDLAKVSEKAARAVAKGAKVYNQARKKSADKKRDGALRDFGSNLAEGLSESISRASSIPVDIADALNTKSARRMLRGQMRLARSGLRLWRW